MSGPPKFKSGDLVLQRSVYVQNSRNLRLGIVRRCERFYRQGYDRVLVDWIEEEASWVDDLWIRKISPLQALAYQV